MVQIQQKSEQWERKRKFLLSSLWHFNKEIFQFPDIDNPFHQKELCDYDDSLEAGEDNHLILWPREHFKTTMFTVGDNLRDISKNRDTRIFVISATERLAKKALKVVARTILKSPRYNFWFPEVRPENMSGITWNTSEFTVNRTEKGQALLDPTMSAFGIDTEITGGHCDKLDFDDIVTRENTQTVERIEKLSDQYGLFQALLEDGGREVVKGTRYSALDKYGEMVDKGLHKYSFRQVTEVGPDGKEEFILPSKWDWKRLNEKRTKMADDFLFYCQYYNTPIARHDRLFKKEDFMPYDSVPDGGHFQISCDPASTTKSYSDESALVCNYWCWPTPECPRGRVFLWRILEAKLNQPALINALLNWYIEFRPFILTIEANSGEGGLYAAVVKEAAARGIRPFRCKAFVPSTKQSKLERIQQLVPWVQDHCVYVREGEHSKYVNESCAYTGFKRGERDHLIDAFAQQLPFKTIPTAPVSVDEEDDDDDEWDPIHEATGI